MRLSIAPLLFGVTLVGCKHIPRPLAPFESVAERTETEEADPFVALNIQFRSAYADARVRTLAKEGPVILAIGDDLILMSQGQKRQVSVIPAAFHDLKAVAHLPLAIYVTVADSAEFLSLEAEATLRDIRRITQEVRRQTTPQRFPGPQHARQLDILDRCDTHMGVILRARRAPADVSVAFARELAPLVLANIQDAAQLQIDAYDRVVAAWRGELPAEEWARTKAIVSGSQLPRNQALPVQYFAWLFGVEGEGRRVIYAESIWDQGKAMNLLGTHVLDRRASGAFFEDPDRMRRDILSDAATAILSKR
jgi:hypothetical protein